MTPKKMKQKVERFAYGKVHAVALNGDPDDCFVQGWYPMVAGKRVSCGSKHPTPQGGFDSKQGALNCAMTYQKLCREWLQERKYIA